MGRLRLEDDTTRSSKRFSPFLKNSDAKLVAAYVGVRGREATHSEKLRGGQRRRRSSPPWPSLIFFFKENIPKRCETTDVDRVVGDDE